jgi:hypothetical protein
LENIKKIAQTFSEFPRLEVQDTVVEAEEQEVSIKEGKGPEQTETAEKC